MSSGLRRSSDTGVVLGVVPDPSEGGTPDADLTVLMAAWPTLPEHIRAAIRALVGTIAGGS
jgi:hypothetical protein